MTKKYAYNFILPESAALCKRVRGKNGENRVIQKAMT